MTDHEEPDGDERGPERTCIVTRLKGPPSRMLRFVVGPDGAVVPDIRARLPGRGAWVDGTAESVALAVKRRAFARAFKREVVAEPELGALAQDLLARDALQALAMVNKAGLAVTGAMKVEGALREGRPAALLHASDGSPDGIRKLDALARGLHGPDLPFVQIFASRQLDLALGRANVIHAALRAGGASAAFLERAARLQRYCEAALSSSTDDSLRPRDATPS